MSDLTVLDLLKQGKTNILERGWAQGEYWNEHGQLCAMGAIDACHSWNNGPFHMPPDTWSKLRDETAFALSSAVPYPSNKFIIEYNDDPGRTVEEILAVYDKAIENEQQRIS